MLGMNVQSRPSAVMPSRYIQTGLLFLTGAAALILLQTDWIMAPPRHNPVTLVLTHMVVLGFGTLITFGALEQMIPVILGQSIASERHSRIAYAHLVPGLLIQLSGFAIWHPLTIAAGGTLIVVGSLVFTLPYVKPLWERRQNDLTARFILASLVYVDLTVLFGIAMAVQLKTLWWPWLFWQGLPFHLILGGLGWFTQIIMGVSYKLIPMFTTTTGVSDNHVRRVFSWFNAGMLASLVAAVFSWLPGTLAGLIASTVGMGLYVVDVRTMLRRRIRRKLGAGMQQSAAAVVYFVATLAACAALFTLLVADTTWPDVRTLQRLITATGFLFAFGWVGNMILGMLSKIAPMLVWLDRFSDLAGDPDTPTIGQLIDEGGVQLGSRAYQVGLLTLFVALTWGAQTVAIAAAAIFLFGVVHQTGTLLRVWFVR